MSLRFFFACFLALAVVFAPFAMPLDEVRAAPAGHHAGMAMADEGHCADQPAPAGQKQDHQKPCCVAGCMAAAMLPAMDTGMQLLPVEMARPGIDRFYRGHLSEIATPPPRAA